MGEDIKRIWLDVRLIARTCNPNTEFYPDDLKAYVGIIWHLAYGNTDIQENLVMGVDLPNSIVANIYSDNDHPLEDQRMNESVIRLKRNGLLAHPKEGGREDTGRYQVMTAEGLPYRTSHEMGYKNEKRRPAPAFQLLRASLFKSGQKKDAVSPFAQMTSEEFLLMLLLFQGSRWVFGGCSQDYVSRSGEKTNIKPLLEAMWQGAITKTPKEHILLSPDLETVLNSLIRKGHFAWARTVLIRPSNEQRTQTSTLNTIVLPMDTRSKSATPPTSVLVPCKGYTMGEYDTHYKKLLYDGYVNYEDMTFSDCIASNFFGMKQGVRNE